MIRTRTLTVALTAGLALAAGPAGAHASSANKSPVMSLCRPVPVKTFHGKHMEARCRLARIDHGTVPCVTLNTAHSARCVFTPTSGQWLESTRGRLFAIAGQPISRDGSKGGNYVIASRLGKDNRPPCAEDDSKPKASISDYTGTPSGIELDDTCIVEAMGSPDNAGGREMNNYATLEVCSTTHGTIDQRSAIFTGSPQPGVYCYKGEGAGLNDYNGYERDQSGAFYQGNPCHVIWTGGNEIGGSKRPAVRSYPSPGRVDPNTPLVWRPWTSVRVAN
jgi:hypothetical protein